MPIQRIVCFKFKPGTPEEAFRQHMADFAAIAPAVEQILDYRAGRTQPGDNNAPPDYDVMHYLTFASMADIEIYRPHPAHQHFIARNKDTWEKVLVLNSEFEG